MRPLWGKNLFLFGDIGIGKTTFLKGFSKGVGVEEHINSPTFALVSEYPIYKNKFGLTTFSHLDIFRVDGNSVLALPEIFEKLEDPRVALALEWAEKLPKSIFPESRIEIRMTVKTTDESRDADIIFFDAEVPDDKSIRMMLDECAVPMNIRKHTALVTKIATLIAKKLIGKRFPVNLDLVRASALLHDCLWVCEHPELVREEFPEDTSDETWAIWQKLHEKYADENSLRGCEKFLREKGYGSTADVVKNYQADDLYHDLTFEEKCLLLGKSYVQNDQVIALSERLKEDSDESGIPKDAKFRSSLSQLELEICTKTGMLPEEIVAMEY